MSELDERLKAIRDAVKEQDTESFLVSQVPALLAALKLCRDQRNDWLRESRIFQIANGLSAERLIAKDDAALAKILEGTGK